MDKNREDFSNDIIDTTNAVSADEDIEDIEQEWPTIKDIYTQAAENIIGLNKLNRKPWISDQTWETIEKRKEIKVKLNSAKTWDTIKDLATKYN